MPRLSGTRGSPWTRTAQDHRPLQGRGDGGNGEFRTDDTRALQHRLLLGIQPVEVALDHLADVARRFDLARIKQRSLRDEVIHHVAHEQRIAVGALVDRRSESQSAQQRPPSPPPVLQGAARGAALGAVGGAITGNAGKGAAAGAAMGGVVGGFRRRDEKMRQADIRADAEAASNPGRPAYMRAMSACLQGRGYTVN
jgi:YMGG-like Gly-zipper